MKKDDVLNNKSYNILNKSSSYNKEKEENNAIQIGKEKLNKKIIEGFRFLYLKLLYNFTKIAYNNIIKLFINENLNLYKVNLF